MQVLAASQQPLIPMKGSLVLVHGLEGSSESGYLRSAGHAALEAGFAVHRTNIRSCGGTEPLCDTLYHAGLTSDLLFILKRLREESAHPLFLAGFSLGANMSLKLAGELGERGRDLLAGVIAVSAPLDLHACAKALNRPQCWMYQRSFVRHMGARLRRRHALMPDLFSLDALPGIRSVYEFDDRITAPFFGFGNAQGYYGTQSSGLFLDDIRIPTLLVHAKDDPMIPFEVYAHPAFARNSALRLLAVAHGGHVGFLCKGPHRFWLDHVIRDWMVETTARL